MAILKNLITYIKDSRVEMKRVNWPTKEQVKDYTILVIALSIAVAVFLGTLDYFFSWTLKTFVI